MAVEQVRRDAELALLVVEGRVVLGLLADEERRVVVGEELVEVVGADHHEDVGLRGGQRLAVGLDLALPLVGLGHPLSGGAVVAFR